ncbi:hypothetical protein [Sphingobium sp. KCTC 72723]|uniref:hypothetical protein n=1 Tax=Sphingobium sp. KCTC 72723 TaxID=2733867 RepID=UPI00165DA8C0|nr:hypothetical protein [Sphingobium sp. KCTC 72723]
MQSQIDLNKLADFMFEDIETSPDYEEDEFSFHFQGVRCYCERYVTHYRIELGHEDDVVELPRH